jgi:hypothetical protein
MDHSTRRFFGLSKQFFSLFKKLHKELRKSLSALNSALQKQSDAIRQSTDAKNAEQRKPPEITSHVHIPQSIEIHQSAEDASHDRGYKNRTVFLSTLSVVVLSFYASIVYLQWKEMIDATGAAQQAVVEARYNRLQSDKVFRATVDQFRLEQRAWVGPVEIGPPPYEEGGKKVYIKLGEKPKFSFVIANSGKTPALKFTSKITSHVYRSTEEFVPYYEKPTTIPTVGTIYPGVRMSLNTLESTGVAEPFHVSTLSSGEYIFYVYAQITYEDIFGTPHKTTFCVFVDKTLTQMLSCNTYNHGD